MRHETFLARAPWWGPDLQTLRNVFRGPIHDIAREAVARDEQYWLDVSDGDAVSVRLFWPVTVRPGGPLVVLVHGLGGSEESAYIQTSAGHLISAGFRCATLNLRGAGPSRARSRFQYHAGRSDDIRDALAGLPADWTGDGVVPVGFSLGGNVLLKAAGEDSGFRAVASISAPIDLEAASMRFLDLRNTLYHWHLLRGMKEEALAPGAQVSDEERAILPGIRTILEFDEKIVAPRNGFEGAADYYARNNARQFLPAIEHPALIVHALDDPWIPAAAYTSFPWSDHPRLTPMLTRGGGHVGFHARGSRTPWHDRCLLAFLERL